MKRRRFVVTAGSGGRSDADMVSACGLYCGACYHYRAASPGGEHLLSEEARGGRPIEGYGCRGCRSEQLYVHEGCRECRIRACAESRELQHCGECAEFPCARLLAFQTDGRKHHLGIVENLRLLLDQGQDDWFQGQAARWQCPECGVAFSWHEDTCHVCGAAISSYGADVLLE
jgi:hypothetical protein